MGKWRHFENQNYTHCVICGKKIYIKPSHISNNHGNCCSYECLGELRKTIYLGENNPNYENRGADNPIWKSDARNSSYGYTLIKYPDHPFANGDGFVFEHRLVAEQYLLTKENSVEIDGQRYLSKEYDVHHKDHNRKNNKPSNLQVLTRPEHMALHAKERRQSVEQGSKILESELKTVGGINT